MRTLTLTQEEFEQFINKKYFLFKATGKKSKNEIELAIRDEYNNNKVVFISSLEKIRLTDSGSIPQLKTLYGIPAGLMELKSDVIVSKAGKKKVKPWESTPLDQQFLTIRRAMLYAHAWSIKGLDMESVRLGMGYILKEPVVQLLKSWLVEFVNAGRFPAIKPIKVSLDHAQYDFQFIGMGVFLRNYFFPGHDSMPADHRDWLQHKLNMGDINNVPEKFSGFEGIFAGYLIALKASNLNKCNLDFILDKVSKFQITDRTTYYGVINAALFFIGLFESKANMYFFAASARKLFYQVEQFCYELVFAQVKNTDFGAAYDSIADAMLNPIPNIWEYYQLKNPAIANNNLIEYDETIDLPRDRGTTLLLRPQQTGNFLRKSGSLWMSGSQISRQLTVTTDESLFRIFKQKAYPSVLISRKGLIEGDFYISKGREIVADSALLVRWIKRYFPALKVSEILLTQQTGKHWVLICNDYRIPEDELFFALRMNSRPSSITVFNFANRPMPISSVFSRSAKKRNTAKTDLFETAEMVSVKPISEGSNSQLQAWLESVLPSVPVRVISRYHQEPPWEMVLLGIGALQEINFNDTTVFDLRKYKQNDEPFEIILRCFRDLIVYDQDQRYMFMNLN